MTFVAVIVAAGSGNRAGGPKQWRPLGGRPVARWALEAMLTAGAAEAVVVIPRGHEDEAEHFRDSLAFYGERLGLKMFRKHLGWYIEQAPWPADAALRRTEKARLCRLETPAEVEAELAALWTGGARLAA